MLKKLAIALPKGFVKYFSLCAVCAIIAAKSNVLGFSSPIGVLISTVLPLPYCFIFASFLFIAEAVLGITAHSLGAAVASLIICLIRLIRSQSSVKNNNFTLSSLPFASYLLSTLVFLVLFSSPFSNYIVLLLFSISIPALVVAYNNRSSKQMASLLFIATITTLSCLDFVYLNLGRTFGVFVVLAIGFYKGAAFSCFVGVLCAISVALYNPAMFPSTVYVCIIALVCSGRGHKDKIRLPLYAVTASLICAVLSGADTHDICLVVDTFVAAIAFIFSEGKINRYFNRFSSSSHEADTYLSLISSYTSSHTHSISSLNSYLNSLSVASLGQKPKDISSNLYSSICLSCQRHDNCFSDKHLEFSASVKNCTRPYDLISSAEKLKAQNDYLRTLSAKRRAGFEEAFSVLNTVQSYIFNEGKLPDLVKNINLILTEKLSHSLYQNKATAQHCAVFTDGSLYVEYPKHKQISEMRLCLLVGELMSTDYPMPEVAVYDNFIRYTFSPRPRFCADFGTVQVSAQSDRCGDSYDCFTVGNTLYYILCDGMGTGKAASVSSSLLIALIKRQLLHNTSSNAAISLSSLIMRLIKLDESFSTLDMLSVNLNTGECEFIKSGSCRSYIIGEGIQDVPTGGYPIGILSETDTVTVKKQISSDCVIVMFSDGAKEIPYQLIEKTVHENITFSSEEIAENILKNSQASLKHSQSDDITVAVIKIESRS